MVEWLDMEGHGARSIAKDSVCHGHSCHLDFSHYKELITVSPQIGTECFNRVYDPDPEITLV